jgi:hypothetical protein
MRLRKMIGFVLLAILLSACNNDATTASSFDTEQFIEDTEEIIAMSESIFYEMREPTVEEEASLDIYEMEYGELEETDTKMVSTYAMLLYYEAIRLEGVENTFMETREELKQYIGDLR